MKGLEWLWTSSTCFWRTFRGEFHGFVPVKSCRSGAERFWRKKDGSNFSAKNGRLDPKTMKNDGFNVLTAEAIGEKTLKKLKLWTAMVLTNWDGLPSFSLQKITSTQGTQDSSTSEKNTILWNRQTSWRWFVWELLEKCGYIYKYIYIYIYL